MNRNPFIDYLNRSWNQNAIGETNVYTDYFPSMQVLRPIIGFLKAKLQAGRFVLLTGHAGDGKTTLLAQVLADMGAKLLNLEKCGDAVGVHYIKDFSELTKDEQDVELRGCFQKKGASVLIANTGPLLGAFRRLTDRDYEAKLLDAMDSTSGKALDIEGFGEVFVLNIARVDNTDFIKPYLHNLLDDGHWKDCGQCEHAGRCPIYHNRNLLVSRYDRAATLMENVYIWLQEYDRRATIRQITAHIAYSITGGLSCRAVERHAADDWRYRYLTSNLFFGCEGVRMRGGARQLRSIQLVNSIGFDRRPTSVDYELFNMREYALYFPKELAELFENAFHTHRYCPPLDMQTMLKRAFLFFGHAEADVEKRIQKEIFSEWFAIYMRICRDGEKPKEYLKRGICAAVNTLFVGEMQKESTGHIDLTLRRNNEQISNVQLLSGRIYKDNVALKVVAYDTVSGKKQFRLQFCAGSTQYTISLPLLNYFYEIYKGVIITDIDPMLSNGIDSLKAQLLSACASATDDNEVPLVFLSGDNYTKRKLVIEPHSIDHE